MNVRAQSGTIRRRVALACGVLASLMAGGAALAQFGPIIQLPPGLPTVMPAPTGGYPPTVAPTAAGPYYASPAWSQTLAPNVRFVILSNFNGDAVLDRETGLIWTRQSLGEFAPRRSECWAVGVGNHSGWRLPTVSELQSLVDASLPSSGQLKLPAGHPFRLPSFRYWSSDIRTMGGFDYRWLVDLRSGLPSFTSNEDNQGEGVVCVLGS